MSIPSVKKQLNFLIEQSRRTIDTIKHQAKTIRLLELLERIFKATTVFNNSIFNADNQAASNDYDFIKDINIFFNKFIQNKNKFDCKKEILVAHKNLDESYAYNVVNFLNDILNKYDSVIKVRLAHDYDLLNKNKRLFNWILLKESNDALDTTNSIDTTNPIHIYI